ncbi:hypothetical protein FACS18949_14140 [Clostridia bacterium]|nr:hypothetical protein FACS189425_03220 [Clostridia bacterium]GHV35693.1 hypothetical protein FACS18949_14140 [Clostridia bacterium]
MDAQSMQLLFDLKNENQALKRKTLQTRGITNFYYQYGAL